MPSEEDKELTRGDEYTIVLEQKIGRPLKTAGGKSFKVNLNTRGNFTLSFTSGGEMPRSLSGKFSNINALVSAVKAYYAVKPVTEEDTDAKTKSNSPATNSSKGSTNRS